MDGPRRITRSDYRVLWPRQTTERPLPPDHLQELRVPTTAVLAHAQLLQRRFRQGTLSPDRLARGIAEIEAAAKRMALVLARLDRTDHQ